MVEQEQSAVSRDDSSGRRILGVYATWGAGPFEWITEAIGRLIDRTRNAPEPIRRILWGHRGI